MRFAEGTIRSLPRWLLALDLAGAELDRDAVARRMQRGRLTDDGDIRLRRFGKGRRTAEAAIERRRRVSTAGRANHGILGCKSPGL